MTQYFSLKVRQEHPSFIQDPRRALVREDDIAGDMGFLYAASQASCQLITYSMITYNMIFSD